MVNDSSLPADMGTLVMERDVQGWQGVFRTNPAFHLVLAFFVGSCRRLHAAHRAAARCWFGTFGKS
ncbi:MAG: hypothetical protein ACYDD9_05120 [Acidithiobacillus sp.]